MHPLTGVRFFALDMDGTLTLGERLLPGARRFLDLLDANDIGYLLLTNNSSKHRGLYAARLRRLGLAVPEERIFTSGEATALTLRRRKPGARVFLVGTPALEEEFRRHGFTLTADAPEYVVLGFDTTLTYRKLWQLCDFVRAGLPYIATHPDLNCPVEGGYMPDIGATIAFVEASTGRRPDVIVGKPNPPIVEALMERAGGLPVEALCMVGDRLYTDIALGATGMKTVLVLTGETRREDLEGSPYRPDLVVRDLNELAEIVKETILPP